MSRLRKLRRQFARKQRRQNPGNRFELESLEPRLLLADDLQVDAFGLVSSLRAVSLTGTITAGAFGTIEVDGAIADAVITSDPLADANVKKISYSDRTIRDPDTEQVDLPRNHIIANWTAPKSNASVQFGGDITAQLLQSLRECYPMYM